MWYVCNGSALFFFLSNYTFLTGLLVLCGIQAVLMLLGKMLLLWNFVKY